MTKVRTGYGDGFTRGGQLFLNRLKNANELIIAAWKGMLAALLVGTLSFAFWQAPTYDRYLLQRWVVSAYWANVAANANKPVELRLEAKDGSISNEVIMVSADQFPQSPMAKQMLWGYLYRMIVGGVIMMILNMALLAYLLWQSKRDNDDVMDDKHVRGTPLGNERQVKRALKLADAPGKVEVGPYTMPQSFETGHFLFLGGHGCGKTNAINRMCTGIRGGGHRAIIYDVAGTYIEKFYRPGIDLILNPLDDRGSPWTIWSDVRIDAEYDYERIVQSLVPSDDPKSAFWYKGAQSLLKGVAKKLQVQGKTTNKDLYDMLVKMELEELCFYCVGTEAGGVISPESERVSADIRATLLTAFTGFKYLRDATEGDALFSIREWMTRDGDDSWLFISSKEDQADTLKGLITMWVDLICANILSLTPSQDRRMWMIFDEAHTLGRLPSLENAQNMSRKYGGCIVIGTQSVEQMAAIYGMDRAKSILGACHTRAFFLCNADTAKWAEQNFGQVERVEASENLSYGPHEFRDGGGVSTKLETRTNVMASQIADLPPLQFYLRLGRGVPNAFVEDKYLSLTTVAPGFVDRPVYVDGMTNPGSETPTNGSPKGAIGGPSSPSASTATAETDGANKEAPKTKPIVAATALGSAMVGPLRPAAQEAHSDEPGDALAAFMSDDDDLSALVNCAPELKAKWEAENDDDEGFADDEDETNDGDQIVEAVQTADPLSLDQKCKAETAETTDEHPEFPDLDDPVNQMKLPLKDRQHARREQDCAAEELDLLAPNETSVARSPKTTAESEQVEPEPTEPAPVFAVKRGRPKKGGNNGDAAGDSATNNQEPIAGTEPLAQSFPEPSKTSDKTPAELAHEATLDEHGLEDYATWEETYCDGPADVVMVLPKSYIGDIEHNEVRIDAGGNKILYVRESEYEEDDF